MHAKSILGNEQLCVWSHETTVQWNSFITTYHSCEELIYLLNHTHHTHTHSLSILVTIHSATANIQHITGQEHYNTLTTFNIPWTSKPHYYRLLWEATTHQSTLSWTSQPAQWAGGHTNMISQILHTHAVECKDDVHHTGSMPILGIPTQSTV